jgi:hypothetical protein
MALRLHLPLDSVRWPDSKRGHVESFFLKANHPQQAQQAFWLKFTLLIPSDPNKPALAEVWALRFDGDSGQHRGSKETFPIEQAALSREGLGFEVAGCSLRPGHTRGAIGTGDDRISWDLHFDYEEQVPWMSLPSAWMYERGFPKNKTYSSCPSTAFSGEFSQGERRERVESWTGMLGHNWGPRHNPAYHWAQCNQFQGSPGTVFEGVSARIALGPFLSPWLTMAIVRHAGEEIRFNRFSRVFNRSVKAQLFSWSFRSRQANWQLKWTVEAPAEDFVALAYIDPDGQENHCLNSKIATCRLELSHKSHEGWNLIADAIGKQSCAYEIISQDLTHGVPVLA